MVCRLQRAGRLQKGSERQKAACYNGKRATKRLWATMSTQAGLKRVSRLHIRLLASKVSRLQWVVDYKEAGNKRQQATIRTRATKR